MPLQIQALPIQDLSVKLEFSGSNIIYRGCHEDVTAVDGNAQWLIWKYTWTGVYLTGIQGPLRGSWDDRTSLGWS